MTDNQTHVVPMTDNQTHVVPTNWRNAIPCLLCGSEFKSVQAHHRHYMICDPAKAKNRARGKVIGK